MGDDYGLRLPTEGRGEEADRNRAAAEVLLKEAKANVQGDIKVEGLWVKVGRGITVQANGRVFQLRLDLAGEEPAEAATATEKEANVSDQSKEGPGARIYVALEQIAKGLNATPPESAGDLHATIMPIVREIDDLIADAWGKVNDGASKGEVLDTLERGLPEFRRGELPARKG